jgi:hypothetical protein
MLVNTQTVAGGNNRVLINNAPPLKLSDSQYIELKKTVGKIALLTMLSKNYPKEGSRDEYCLIIAGCLVRYTSWTTSEREDFMRILCQVNNDTEVKSRVSKITYQEEQYKLNKEVYGVKAFAEHIKRDVDICINWFNWINNENLSEKSIDQFSLLSNSSYSINKLTDNQSDTISLSDNKYNTNSYSISPSSLNDKKIQFIDNKQSLEISKIKSAGLTKVGHT